MTHWGPREVAKRDTVRRVLVGVAVTVGFVGALAGITILFATYIKETWAIAMIALGMTGSIVFVPLGWAVLVRELRRKEAAALHGIDLRGAQAVDMSLQVKGEDIGKDVGFLVFRQGTFAFLGLRSRFAFACANTKVEKDPNNYNRIRASATHKHGKTHFLLVPSDRLMFKGGKIRKLERDFAEHKGLDRPHEWFDVLPPPDIDPTIEVTEKDLGKVKRMWIAYAFLCSLPLLSIVINLLRGQGAFENFTLHSIIFPITGYMEVSRQSNTARNRFLVHEEIRSGKVLPHSEGRPLEASKVP